METNDLKIIDIKRDCKSPPAFCSTAHNKTQTRNNRFTRLLDLPHNSITRLKQVGYFTTVLTVVTVIAALTACSTTSIPLTQKDRDSIKTIYVSKLIVRDARPALLRLDAFRGPVEYGDVNEWHMQQRHNKSGNKDRNNPVTKNPNAAAMKDRKKNHNTLHDFPLRGDLVRYYDGNLPSPGYYEIYNNEKIYNKKLSEHFAADEKRIDQVLYESFVKEWEKRGLFPLTPSMEPDAIIKLELINYGLLVGNVNNPSSTVSVRYNDKGYAPYMMVRAYIVDSNNKVIWQEEAEYELFLVGAQNRLRLQQWISRPEELHSAFQEVSDILSEAIVSVLAKKFKNPVVSTIK